MTATRPPLSRVDLARIGRALADTAHLRDLPGRVPPPDARAPLPPLDLEWSPRRGRFSRRPRLLTDRAYAWLQAIVAIALIVGAALISERLG